VTDLAVADVILTSVRGAVVRLDRYVAELSLGDDVEAVHQARVATRRLRSDLRTFAHWLDDFTVTELRGELRWVGAELGVVRDLDVMRSGLRTRARGLPPTEAEAAEHVIRRLDADRSAAHTDLLAALRHPRYAHLHDALTQAAAHPPVNKHAGERARDVLAPAVRKRWKALRRAVGRLGEHPPDEALHAVRIRAKRVRYAAEAVAPAFGDDARVFAKKMARLQDVLGDQHDTVVAIAWLAKTAHECTPGEAYAVGMLAQLERIAGDELRAAYPSVWDEARQKSLRAWM